MDVVKKSGGSHTGFVPDPLMPHSPTQAHHHVRVGPVEMGTEQAMSSGSDSGSSSEDRDSDVSDMVIDNSSKFAALSKGRRKSGESDYVPHSDSHSPESQSESESESNSEQSADESDSSEDSRVPPSKPPTSSLIRRPSDESDRSSCSSSQLTPLQQRQLTPTTGLGKSPLIKRGSPFAKSNTRNILNDVTMRKHSYELCPPRRQAALNPTYTFYDNDSGDEVDIRPYQSRKMGRRRRRSPSGSEYEASDLSSRESSGEDSFIVDESDDDYRPGKRPGRAGGRGRRKVRDIYCTCMCKELEILVFVWWAMP